MQNTSPQSVWYLGIDLGTTGLSAALLNRLTCELYPIYWLTSDFHAEVNRLNLMLRGQIVQDDSAAPCFRLPVVAYLSENELKRMKEEFIPPSAFRPLASEEGMLLENFKPYLQLGIAGISGGADPTTTGTEPSGSITHSRNWEPVLQWSEEQLVPLGWVLQALQGLLSTLRECGEEPTPLDTRFICGAAGMEAADLRTALSQLRGVILGQPSNWPDSYSFNLREAVVGAKLVDELSQIFFVEDAIATLLSVLRGGKGETVVRPSSRGDISAPSQAHNLFNAVWQGGTLVLDAGATTTELALVNLPENLNELTHSLFSLSSFAYAGNGIDQDIICQMLLSPNSTLRIDFDLPRVGEPDEYRRRRLHQRLQSSAEGLALLEAARQLKLKLQNQEQFIVEVGGRPRVVTQQALESKVLWPFIQGLNKELNALLSYTGMPVQGIKQAICTGGTGSMGAIARWLRQKLPNATIIQDTYPEVRPVPCSRVAYGLATLPLHPQVFNVPKQQYSDYFLLSELLCAVPNQSLEVGEIIQLLELRGINTRQSHSRIIALLEGHLPPGLVPVQDYGGLLSASNKKDGDFEKLGGSKLFYKEDEQTYRPNQHLCQELRYYLKALTARTQQKLEEPLTLDLAIPTRNSWEPPLFKGG